MTLLLVFVGCLFTIFALWLSVAPFLGGADRGVQLEYLDEEVREIELLVARRQVLLTALRELDFDREMDKIAADDYEKFRRRYEAEAVSIMRRLDEIHGGRDWRQRVDDELTEILGHAPTVGAAAHDAETTSPDDEEVEGLDVNGADDQPDTELEESDDASEDEANEASDDDADEAQKSSDDEASDASDDDEVDEASDAPDGEVDEASDASDDEADQHSNGEIESLALEPAPQICAGCGEDLEPDDKFCSQCGTPVAHAEDTATPPAKSEASA